MDLAEWVVTVGTSDVTKFPYFISIFVMLEVPTVAQSD